MLKFILKPKNFEMYKNKNPVFVKNSMGIFAKYFNMKVFLKNTKLYCLFTHKSWNRSYYD